MATSYTPDQVKRLVDQLTTLNTQVNAGGAPSSALRSRAALMSQLSSSQARAAKNAGNLSLKNGSWVYNANPSGLAQTLVAGKTTGKTANAPKVAGPTPQ